MNSATLAGKERIMRAILFVITRLRLTGYSHRQRRQSSLAFYMAAGLLGYLGPFSDTAAGQASGQASASLRPLRPAASETRRSPEEALPVEVKDMVLTRAGIAVTLVSDETQQQLHLMIGSVEGQAIVRALRHADVPRPQTHDLMKTMLERDGWRVTRVVIRDLSDGTYYADIVMQKRGDQGAEERTEERTIDARPSDAMALGLRFEAPIYVRQKVFDQEREQLQQAPSDKHEAEPETLTI
jgi:uncharacterized protein